MHVSQRPRGQERAMWWSGWAGVDRRPGGGGEIEEQYPAGEVKMFVVW